MTSDQHRIVAQDTDPNSERKPARLVVEGPEGIFAIADLLRKVVHTHVALGTFQRHGYVVPTEGQPTPAPSRLC
jgi:hypothetical protein